MDGDTFATTRPAAFRENQTVRHVYRDRVKYADVRRGTWNRLERELGITRDSEVAVYEAVCGMDVDRVAEEFSMVGAEELEALLEEGVLCERCYGIVTDG